MEGRRDRALGPPWSSRLGFFGFYGSRARFRKRRPIAAGRLDGGESGDRSTAFFSFFVKHIFAG
jgi:hypothetical protein